MHGTIQMRFKGDALICDVTQIRKTHHLKATAIRQNGSGPPGKAMQPAQFSNQLMAGAKIQMVRITQHQSKPA